MVPYSPVIKTVTPRLLSAVWYGATKRMSLVNGVLRYGS